MGISRKVLNWYARMSPARGVVPPPYMHVVQIGDPKLRRPSELVPLEAITSQKVKTVLEKLQYVLIKYDSVGMSAPQIGINWRIFVMQHTHKQIAGVAKEEIERKGMKVVPFTLFINPKLKVKDYSKLVHHEGCESIRGFSAHVPRFRAVEVTGYNEKGEQIQSTFSDWAARIVQHEMDHLDGCLFTDKMDVKTLECTCWQEVNLSQGKVALPFMPD